MFETGMTVDRLRTCLAAVEAVELLGMVLLKQYRPQGQFFPADVPRSLMKEAVAELVAYTDHCAAAASRLANLTPIPLRTASLLEFGL